MIGTSAPNGASRWVRSHPVALAAAVLALTALIAGSSCVSGRSIRHGEDPGPPPPPVALGGFLRLNDAPEGYRRPQPLDENCLRQALRRQPALAGLDTSIRVAVMRDGSVRDCVCLRAVNEPIQKAIEIAFRSCRWSPALDPQGHPLAVWVIQPIKVAALE